LGQDPGIPYAGKVSPYCLRGGDALPYFTSQPFLRKRGNNFEFFPLSFGPFFLSQPPPPEKHPKSHDIFARHRTYFGDVGATKFEGIALGEWV
jgi:hypothetical protein